MSVLILLPENFLPPRESFIPASWVQSNTGVSQMMAALSTAFLEHGVPYEFFSGDRLEQPRRRVLEGRFTGMISMARGVGPGARKHLRAMTARLPTISLMTGWRNRSTPYVGLDNHRAISLLVHHLVSEGHRRIAFFGPHFHPSVTLLERVAAWRQCLTEKGLPSHRGYCLGSLDQGVGGSGDFHHALARWFPSMEPRPDAVICYSDGFALMLLQYLETLGLSVPGDVSITGINGNFLDHPRLGRITTILNHFPLAARTAANLLLEGMMMTEVIKPDGAARGGNKPSGKMTEVIKPDGATGGGQPHFEGSSGKTPRDPRVPTRILITPELVVGNTSRRKSALPRDKDRDFLGQVLAFTREHLAEADLTARLAERCELSRAHFRLKFASIAGESFHVWVARERLALVASRLRLDQVPVADLARVAGFHNMSGFNRLFKRRYGMTPRSYRSRK